MNNVLLQWFYSPGRTLHADWWKIALAGNWKDKYQPLTALGRELDIQLRLKLQLPAYTQLNFPLTPQQYWFLRAGSRMRKILVAAGIYLSGCPDYVTIRTYRNELRELISQSDINQLGILLPQNNSIPEWLPETLVANAFAHGLHAINNSMKGDPLWEVVRIQFQNPGHDLSHALPVDTAVLWLCLQRLEHFL